MTRAERWVRGKVLMLARVLERWADVPLCYHCGLNRAVINVESEESKADGGVSVSALVCVECVHKPYRFKESAW